MSEPASKELSQSKWAIWARANWHKRKSKVLSRHKEWAAKNKPRLAEYARKRRSEKPELREHIRQYGKKYYQANKERMKLAARQNRERNLDRRRQTCKEWHTTHRNLQGYKEDHRKRSAENYQKNKSRIKKRHAEWFKKNPGAYAALKARRRALEKYAAVNLHKIKEWMDCVKGKDTAVCYYCQRRVSTKGIHFDHIVALTKGGPHRVENLCVACETCNISKHNKPLRIWTRHAQQMLEL